jgi:hypothetical protein
MPVIEPTYGLSKFDTKEPAGMTAAIVNATVDSIVTALGNAGIPPADLPALIAAGWFSDSGWQSITVAGGFAATTQAPQVRKIGKIVVARGGWSNTGVTASTTHTNVGTIPSGYRPSSGLDLAPGLSAAGTSSARLSIATTGVVTLQTSGSVAAYFRLDGVTWTVD